MGVQNTFISFFNEIKKSVQEKQLSENLHNTFVMFVYTLYNFVIYHVMLIVTSMHYFIVTYLPLPKINST